MHQTNKFCLWERILHLAGVPYVFSMCAKSVMSAALVHRLGKHRIMPWPASVAGSQGQGMGASSARSSKVQIKQGITSGATSPAQLSLSLSATGANPLPQKS